MEGACRRWKLRLGLLPAPGQSGDEFLEATTDLWELAPERATRVGHPAPFPVELPRRLIELYTYEDDVVLDPFMGSGSTAVAAVETKRCYIGYETDRSYVERANQRLHGTVRGSALRHPIGGFPGVSEAVREGSSAKEVAINLLRSAGFGAVRAGVKVPRAGVELSFAATDQKGEMWYFDLAGSFSISDSSLRRSDVLWRAIGRASVVQSVGCMRPLVLLATELPHANSSGARSLKSITGPGRALTDVIDLLDPHDQSRLQSLAFADDALLREKEASDS